MKSDLDDLDVLEEMVKRLEMDDRIGHLTQKQRERLALGRVLLSMSSPKLQKISCGIFRIGDVVRTISKQGRASRKKYVVEDVSADGNKVKLPDGKWHNTSTVDFAQTPQR